MSEAVEKAAEVEDAPTSITLKGREYAIMLPTDFATRRELTIAMENNIVRGACALIGYCLPGLGLRPLYVFQHYNALRFGAVVWEKLSKGGMKESELPEIGIKLYAQVHKLAYPPEVAIDNAVNFTSPTAGAISK